MELIAIFRRLFNWKDEKSVGRSAHMVYSIMYTLANVFVTGTFYTGFLANNGIDIVKVGIITFIPYFCWIFGLFGPRIMQHFKSRRGILLFSHIFYYSCIILGTTVMPMFVEGPDARTVWFAVFLVAGNVVNALFSGGATAWTVNFYPEGKERTAYFSITYLVNNITNMVVALGVSALTDALAGSPAQATVIVVLRYISYGCIIAGGLISYLVPKEYPYVLSEKKYGFKELFLKPVCNRAYFLTVLIAVFWNFACVLNDGTWSYYILNTVGVSYSLTYISTAVTALGGFFLTGIWRQLINRYGWYYIIICNVLISAVANFLSFLFGPSTIWLYALSQVLSGINLIGAQINFATVPLANLPKEDKDIYFTFYSFIINIFMFLGSALGTWLLTRLEVVGAEYGIYGSRLLVLIKAALFALMAIYIWRVIPVIRAGEKTTAASS